jgi:hypothetical protein
MGLKSNQHHNEPSFNKPHHSIWIRMESWIQTTTVVRQDLDTTSWLQQDLSRTAYQNKTEPLKVEVERKEEEKERKVEVVAVVVVDSVSWFPLFWVGGVRWSPLLEIPSFPVSVERCVQHEAQNGSQTHSATSTHSTQTSSKTPHRTQKCSKTLPLSNPPNPGPHNSLPKRVTHVTIDYSVVLSCMLWTICILLIKLKNNKAT